MTPFRKTLGSSVFVLLLLLVFYIAYRSPRTACDASAGRPQARRELHAPPSICFIHITNSPVSFTATDDSAYNMGMFHVFDYARRHGYAYLRVMDTTGSSHRHGVWVKPKHLSRALQEYEVVVLMDMDLLIPDPTIPFHFLLDRWGWGETTLVLQAMDPDQKPRNYVRTKQGTELLMANTGFVVFRRHPKVMRLLDQWYHCRDTTTLGRQGCLGYNFTGMLNQPPYNLLVRPQLSASELIILPCEEANGYPASFGDKNHGCVGKYIWHPWFHKDKVRRVLAGLISVERRQELIAELVHGNHLRYWIDPPPVPDAQTSYQ